MMSSSVLRRPWRAFLLTPLVFILLYFGATVVPDYIVNNNSSVQQPLSILLLFTLFGVPIAFLAIVILGLPSYYFLKDTKFETAVTSILLTAIAASIVYFFMEIDLTAPAEGSSYSWGDGKGDIIQDNVRTAYGWMVFAKNLFGIFICGAVSGLVFWRLYSGKWWGRIDA